MQPHRFPDPRPCSGGGEARRYAAARVLYSLARREAASARIKDEAALPARGAFPARAAEPRCDARARRRAPRSSALRHAFASGVAEARVEQYVAGAHKARVFRERVADFKARTKDLGKEHLIKLLDATATVAAKLPDLLSARQAGDGIEIARRSSSSSTSSTISAPGGGPRGPDRHRRGWGCSTPPPDQERPASCRSACGPISLSSIGALQAARRSRRRSRRTCRTSSR